MNLAARLRPTTLSEFVGQAHLVGKGKIISAMLESKGLYSMMFWGPPGCGKTTLAQLIARESNAEFMQLSGVSSGKADLTNAVSQALENEMNNKRTILFIDEIHRWNKAQQDSLLPHVESGLLILIGATTENPSFEIISPLLSRSRVFILKPLTEEELSGIIDHALTDKEKGVGSYKKTITSEAKKVLIDYSSGDARTMLNALEVAVMSYKEKNISAGTIADIFQNRASRLYDKAGEEHYNIISAFIKSMRGSDPDATLYYLHRMIDNGEDPKFIARRMVIFASEDIGLADRGALIQANAAFDAVHKIGYPECALTLTHAAMYLATAKKSRAVANALMEAKAAVKEYPNEPVPLHLRNAPTKFMKEIGYSKGYEWSEKHVGPTQNQSFLPDKLKGKKFVK